MLGKLDFAEQYILCQTLGQLPYKAIALNAPREPTLRLMTFSSPLAPIWRRSSVQFNTHLTERSRRAHNLTFGDVQGDAGVRSISVMVLEIETQMGQSDSYVRSAARSVAGG